MTAKLLIREVGTKSFVQQNGDFDLSEEAYSEGERMCREGNVDAFEIWILGARYERKTIVEQVDG